MASSFVAVVLLRILDTASEEAKLYLLEYFSNVVFSSVNGYLKESTTTCCSAVAPCDAPR